MLLLKRKENFLHFWMKENKEKKVEFNPRIMESYKLMEKIASNKKHN